MKGGWRYGAGRPGWHAKTGRFCRLDIGRLKRHGALRPGCVATCEWGDRDMSVNLVARAGAVTASYRFRFREGWQSVSQELTLERTPCHYGGERVWFRCPRCHRRAVHIYLYGWPMCRQCARLVYPSQSEGETERSWRRTRKLERLLAPADSEWNGWQRPEGMRQKTFDRLVKAYRAEESYRDELLCVFAMRYFGKAP